MSRSRQRSRIRSSSSGKDCFGSTGANFATSGGFWQPGGCARPLSTRYAERAILLDHPARVVGDLPRVSIGVDEDPVVAAPEGLARLACDRRPGGARLFDDGADFVVG